MEEEHPRANRLHHEQLLVTRLYSAQRRLRWTRGVTSGLRWFAAGSVLASFVLVILWNWNYVPGPWQWLAAAGRPREVLWLPFLTALGGFASLWLVMPSPRQAAYKLDRLLDSQERLLTSVDWILSEKPRTETSQRLLEQAAGLVEEESSFQQLVKRLERLPKATQALLLSIAAPALLLYFLPPNAGMPHSTALWLGESQVDQLTEELLKELEDTGGLKNPEERLEELLQKLKDPSQNPELSKEQQTAQRELQRLVDQMLQQAESREKARQLLETLAERARQKQEMSEKDQEALEALKKKLADKNQADQLEQATEQWEQENFQQAAETLENLQQQMGQSAQDLSEQAQGAAQEGGLEQDGGAEFDEQQGDQFDGEGRPKDGSGQGQGDTEAGQGSGQGQGQGDGESGIAAGEGTTLEDRGEGPGRGARQSLRRSDKESDWVEEYEHLHAPERTEFEKAQTRVRGEMGEEGPRFRTYKEGYGQVTEPSQLRGSGGLLRYRERAESAILREEVPADYRDNVRVYFESLDSRP